MQKQVPEPSPCKRSGKGHSEFNLRFIAKSVVNGKVRRAQPLLLIDGEPIEEQLPIDLWVLVKSVLRPGRHYIYTCSCGDPGCAGVEEGIRVGHRLGRIIWEYRLPQSTDSYGDDPVSPYKSWLKQAAFHRHVFCRAQVIKALSEALSDAEATHADDAVYAAYGFRRKHISELIAAISRLR
jgi:hypothetical protein